MKSLLPIFVASLLLAMPAWASTDHASHGGDTHAAQSAGLAEGQVRKIDRGQGKLTLRHGPLENLGMPPMTMVFRVQNPAMLDRVAPGDNVRFFAERVNGAITITRLEISQ